MMLSTTNQDQKALTSLKVKNFMNKLHKFLFLTAISSLYGIQTAQATSTFQSQSSVSISIDNITNNTNTGDYSSLDIYGLFEPSYPIKIITGDADSNKSYTSSEIDSDIAAVSAGDSFNQIFNSSGNANNGGNVEAFYEALGSLEFINNSSDSFTIEYSLNYILNAQVTGDHATNTIAIGYGNILTDINWDEWERGDVYLDASASTEIPFLNDGISATPSFSLTLGAFESNLFYADVSITSYAEALAVAPVPAPAAGWLMLSSLVFLRNYRKAG